MGRGLLKRCGLLLKVVKYLAEHIDVHYTTEVIFSEDKMNKLLLVKL